MCSVMGVNHADEWPRGQVAHTNERKSVVLSQPSGVRCWRHDDRMDERRRGRAPHGGRRDGLAAVELDRSREGERGRSARCRATGSAHALPDGRHVGAEDDAIVSLVDVVTHWMGPRSIETVDRMVGRAALVTVDGRARIVAHRGAPDLRFAVAHELGHWALRTVARAELGHAEEERAANTFAAALLAPSPLVRAAYELFGERHDVMAERLRISQTSTVLRLGEVSGDPRAVVTRTGHVFVRNQSPTLTRERAAAVAHGRPVRGVAKARLRGGIDEGRVALRVG